MSIVALCQAAAERCPAAPLFSYLTDGETQAVSLSRGELHQQACRVAAELLRRGMRGRRVLLLFVPGLDFIVSFVGCLYAGAIAVPAYPPDPGRLQRTLPRLASIVADCEPALVLTTAQLLEMAPFVFSLAPELAQVTWAASDQWMQAAEPEFAAPLPRPDDLAFIQYTSGSTATPKGVMIGHDNLLANLRQLQHARRGGEHTTIVSWLPFYHDLGLIGAILFPLFLGGRSILMSPIDFLKRPSRWLQAIHRYRADTSAAPNFALDLCVRKVTAQELAGLDLSCWTMALIGAEPLQRATLDRFAATLAPHGLHPHTLFQGYGLAEGVLASVCGSVDSRFRSGSFDAAALRSGRVRPAPEGAAASRMIVSCGTPVLDQRVEIVDPATQERCESDQVGEIWIAGPNVARGYWNRPEESAATFGARLAGSDARFLRTGDLGFFAEGELYVAGRIKDLIIIRGKNHHPQDIEQTVESCHPLLRPGCIAAFSLEDGGGERLVIAAELDAKALPQAEARAAAIAAVCEAIRSEVSQQHELQVHAIALLEPGQLPKTSSGKLMRRLCRSEFLAGKLVEIERSLLSDTAAVPGSPSGALPVAPELRTESGLAAWIRARLVERLGVPAQVITAELPFAELGLDSREAIGLVGDLEAALDRKLPATLLFDYPNIAALARFLTGADSGSSTPAASAPVASAPHAHQRRSASQLDPATARICIIGAGPAGLTAAYDLSQLGYRRITLFEKRSDVGGKVMSAELGGQAYELGQLFFTSAYKQTLELLRAFDIPLEQNAIATCHIDLQGQPLPPPNAAATHAWMMRLLATAGFRADELAVHAAHDRPELWEPMESWLKRHALWPLPQNVLISWIAFGYGFPTDGLPIWYLLTYIMVLLSITTAERYSVPGGNQSLWRRIASHLQSRGVELRTGVQVHRIERSGGRVNIALDGESPREFDALILACPPDAAASLLEASAPERELLTAFRHYDYVSAMFQTEGLGSQRQFSFDRSFHPDGIGEVLCLEHRPESNIVTLGQYGSPYGQFAALSEAELVALSQQAIERLGGRMVETLALERWRFFFHLPPAEMGRGVLAALEARQGEEQTYFAGSYLTMETLEHTVAYTRELIAHFFAPAASVNAGPLQKVADAAEPIAIIGMGCRLPGGADDPAALWQLLDRGGDAVSEVPPERWSAERFYSADPAMPGRTVSRWGGYLRNLDEVDPAFFGLSPREARSLDPQGRLLLEVSWEALEDAGIVPGQLMGTDTGVFVGMSGVEYQLYALSDPQAIDGHSLLGSMHSTIAGRLSYWLGLKGPNLPVDTACSSSLVALHLACQSLRLRECSLALTGGANVTLSYEGTIGFSKTGVLSPTGRCRTFSSDADGIVRADGCGVLVLKRLSDARRDGDRILGVIRGSAVNQDGRSNGLTAPSGLAQQEVIRRALGSARLGPQDIDYIECHGTGTALGDPIEVQALGSVFKERSGAPPLRIGSIKTNIGHAEAASGVAGVMKAVLSLRHQRIPQSLHFTAPNPHISWSELPVQVAAAGMHWPAVSRPRRAGVSAFGLSGTNAHIILEEAPPAGSSAAEPPSPLPVLPFVISGKTGPALQAQARRLHAYLEAQPQLRLQDVAWSLATARTHFEERAVVLTADRSELLRALDALASEKDAASLVTARPGARGRLAMLFTGQGSQRPGMGRELCETFPVFRQALDQICQALDPHLPRPLLSVLFAEAGSAEAALLDQTEFTQPALFALEVALFRLWEAWGVRPELVAGHSVGELAAAHVAGVLSLEEACKLVAARGRLMGALPGGGAMVAIAAEEQEVRKLLRERGGQVDIAAQNGPLATVIAGDEAAVLAIAEHFAALGRSTSRLAVSHAFHSAHMEPMLAAWRAEFRQLRTQAPHTPLVSLVTGKLIGKAELASPDHWAAQVRNPVRFLDGLYTLQASDATLYLELGPQAVLSHMGSQSLAGEAQPSALFVPSLRRSQPEGEALLRALASLHVQGYKLDWQRCLQGCGGQRISLPTYAFQRERLWIHASLDASPRPDVSAQPPAAAPVAAEAGPELDEVLLQTRWRQTVGLATSGFTRPGRWLLLADRQGLANRIETGLESMGSAVVRVEMLRPGQTPPRGWHTVDPQDPDAVAAMLEKVTAAKQPLRGVIYLWGLDAPQLTAGAEALVHASWSGALNLAQALARRKGATVPRLHIVTVRACAPESPESADSPAAPRPEQALLFGLGTAISAQLPALRCQQIDVADPTSGQEAASLLKELLADSEESQIALRRDQRYVARILRHAPLPAPDTELVAASGQPFALSAERRGSTTLLIARSAGRRQPGPGEIEVAVARAALHEAGPLSAVAGKVTAVGEGVDGLCTGQAVVGLLRDGLMSHVTAAAELFVACPPELTQERAAAAALAYPQVRHALEQQAELGPGDRLLILGAERPQWLAALHIARLRGAEVFVAQPAGPHSALEELAPDHIVNSAALPAGFAIDVILNAGLAAVPRELLPALRRGGTLVDLDLGRLIERRPERVQALLASTISALASGALPRLTPPVVPLGDLALAARRLAAGGVLNLADAPPLLLASASKVQPAPGRGGTWMVNGSSRAAADAAASWLVHRDAELRTLATAQAASSMGLAPRGLLHIEEPLPAAVLSPTADIWQVLSGRVQAVWEAARAAERLGIAELIVIASGAAWSRPAAAFADASLDAFVAAMCALRRSQGRQALDLHYGRFAREGSQLLGLPADAAERRALLDSLLRARSAQSCILIQNASARLKQLDKSSELPLYRELLPERGEAGNGKLIGELLSLPLPEATPHLSQLIRGRIAALLSEDAETIDIQAPLNLLGVDSMTALELASRIQSDIGLRIPGQILFEQGSILSISEYLLSRLFSQHQHKEIA